MLEQLVVLPPSSLATDNPVDTMVTNIVSFVGLQDDPDARAMALAFLDRAADRMNLAGIHLWALREQSVALATGDQTVALAANWGFAFGTPKVTDANGDHPVDVRWLPWDQFSRLDWTEVGEPTYLGLRSDIYDGTLYIYPVVDSTTDGKLLSVPYIARIQRPSQASTLYLTAEARECLQTGGLAFMAQFRYPATPQVWLPYFQDFEARIKQARAAGQRSEALTNSAFIQADMTGMPEWP